jgi:ComF family protein
LPPRSLCIPRARSFAAYHETLRAAVALLKYEGVTPLGGWFAGKLFRVFMDDPDRLMPDVVVPVPLHPLRLRERGYNQAELIAKPLARRLGLPLASLLLVRTQPRPDKLLLSRHERWNTVRGAYATRQGARVDNRSVLLIDDVFTTGATLDACARVLRGAGAVAVHGLTVARAMPDWTPDGVAPRREIRETRTVPPAS